MNDDLVSVEPGGKVALEKGSHGGRGIYWVLKNVLLGPGGAVKLEAEQTVVLVDFDVSLSFCK